MNRIRPRALISAAAVLLSALLLSFTASFKPQSSYDFSYEWTKKGNIAHGMGLTAEGARLTNSKEAFIHNYEKGFRIFEVDVMRTKDNILICGHRWDDVLGKELYESLGGESSSAAMTWEELKSCGIQGRYTPLRFSDLALLLKDYPDAYIVLDMKQTKPDSVREIYKEIREVAEMSAPEVLDRMIPQVFNDDTLDTIMEIYPFRSCIYSCYKTKAEKFPEYVAGYAGKCGIGVITVDHNKESVEWNAYLNKAGFRIYYNTINDSTEEEELKNRGVYGVYTDTLTE